MVQKKSQWGQWIIILLHLTSFDVDQLQTRREAFPKQVQQLRNSIPHEILGAYNQPTSIYAPI